MVITTGETKVFKLFYHPSGWRREDLFTSYYEGELTRRSNNLVKTTKPHCWGFALLAWIIDVRLS
jgi:hypothetical protein